MKRLNHIVLDSRVWNLESQSKGLGLSSGISLSHLQTIGEY
jgi:hypothetical protein